jgi:hypothetical protein
MGVSAALVATLWLAFTVNGLRMARRRRFGEHRVSMIRSFALTMSIIVSRFISVPAIIALAPQVDTTFGGSEDLMLHSATSIKRLGKPRHLTRTRPMGIDRRGPSAPRSDGSSGTSSAAPRHPR